jgi:hypothetical protein
MGHEFRNVAPTIGGSGTANFRVEFAINNGSWQLIQDYGGSPSASNLYAANYAGMMSGFDIKFRFTRQTGSRTEYIDAFHVECLCDYDTYPYPLDSYALTIGPVASDTEIRIMETGTANEIAGIEQVGATGYFSYTYGYDGTPFGVDINVLHVSKKNVFLQNVELGEENQSIYISQENDRSYENPL